jgi:pimeloyl-ACP methyl ester carboxylesterase
VISPSRAIAVSGIEMFLLDEGLPWLAGTALFVASPDPRACHDRLHFVAPDMHGFGRTTPPADHGGYMRSWTLTGRARAPFFAQ